MPIAGEHSLNKPQHLQDDGTKIVFWACNCSSQPANRTLRYVAANRDKFTVWPPRKETQDVTQTA